MNDARIRMSFDDDRLRRYCLRGRSPSFIIYWQVDDGECYPDNVWFDFGIVILGWWARVSLDLAGVTASSDMPFMEGPYRIYVTHYHEDQRIELRPARTERVWVTSYAQFNQAIIDAADTIQQELIRLEICQEEQVHLGQLKDRLAALH